MAKAFVACFRNKIDINLFQLQKEMFERIRPDNAVVQDPYIYEEEQLFASVFNPSSTFEYNKGNFYLGVVTKTASDVLAPRSPRPDGTFALFRSSSKCVEILSDYTGTRTIWYYLCEELFVASTSQRLIISFLGDFIEDQKAISWMLLTGTLGPGLSWDSRLNHVPPNSTVLLNRAEWKLSVECDTSMDNQSTVSSSINDHRQRLKGAVARSIQSLNIDSSKWALALSGGMDSRSILFHLKDDTSLNTITWGLKENMGKPDNDATVARRLANHCSLKHQYFETDISDNIPKVFNRFLVAGEGRVDHLSGYMDGLTVWRDLSLAGRGIIRGYDPFGSPNMPYTEKTARQSYSLYLTEDFTDLPIPARFDLSHNDIPQPLWREKGEGLKQWQDRLWLKYRTPFITAALDEIKAAYVEIANPLLCKDVVSVVERLPNKIRIKKQLWEEIVTEMFPKFQFAKCIAGPPLDNILNMNRVKEFLQVSLLQHKLSPLFPKEFLIDLSADIGNQKKGKDVKVLKAFASRYLPKVFHPYIKKFYQKNKKPRLNSLRLALRTVIVLRMNQILCEDASVGKSILSVK